MNCKTENDFIYVSPSLDEDCVISTAILIAGGLDKIPSDIKFHLKKRLILQSQTIELCEPSKDISPTITVFGFS